MPLLDHFHAPLYPTRSWESFHSRWANSIADSLQVTLPSRYFAEVQIHLGTHVEADVAEFEVTEANEQQTYNGAGGGTAIAVQPWAPPAPPVTENADFPDNLIVEIRDSDDDARLVGVVELVSPRNKDRADSRESFAIKCASYLKQGVGLVVIDVVTNRRFNLHNELTRLLKWSDKTLMPEKVNLYAVSYRPIRRKETNQIDIWPAELTLGTALPVVPLPIRGYGVIPLDLEATYADACQRSRLLEA